MRQTADVNLCHVTEFSPYFPFTLYCFYTKISSFMPVLTIGIVRDCFYLLIFYSAKFSTWVWRLPFAVNVNLNLSNRELFTANGKTSIWTTWPRCCHLLFNISTHKNVGSCQVHPQKVFWTIFIFLFSNLKNFQLESEV